MESFIHGEIWGCCPRYIESLTAELADVELEHLLATGSGSQHSAQETETPPDGVVFLDVSGMILHRRSIISEYLGATTLDVLGAQFRKAMASDAVTTIVFVVDSPGGTVTGVQELSAAIYEARKDKRILAFVSGSMLASSAYWICSAAHEIISTPSATSIGSIGVMRIHRSGDSGNVTIIRSSGATNKARLNPYEPLTDDLRAREIQTLDSIHSQFENDIARNRGLSVDHVRKYFGHGAEFISNQALTRGMIDRLQSWDEFIGGFGLKQDLSRIEIQVV